LVAIISEPAYLCKILFDRIRFKTFMRLIILVTFLIVGHFSSGQTFTDAYRKFQTARIKSDNLLDSLRKTEYNKSHIITKKIIKKNKKDRQILLSKQILEFDMVFRTYKTKHRFDFNTADSLVIFYQTDVQTQLNDFIVLSGKDTVTYGEDWRMISLHQFEREVIYKPFFPNLGYNVNYTEARDTLLALVTKNDFATAKRLEKEHPVLDGASSTIILAKKVGGHYVIAEYHFRPIGLVPIRKPE
jgi:hypothetical protein